MILRPYGVVLEGSLEVGLEIVVEGGAIAEIRPHTGLPEPWIASAPFVNGHSHLEYRGLQDELCEGDYWPWIREITRRKTLQAPEHVAADCLRAAKENRATGVAWIAEHADRPGPAAALAACGLKGAIYQELITFFEQASPEEKVKSVEASLTRNQQIFHGSCGVALHAAYTVDESTLIKFAQKDIALSIHVAEHPDERAFFEDGRGAIADFYRANGFEPRRVGLSPTRYLNSIGLLRRTTQLVHLCDVDDADIQAIAESGATIAHCPRSNVALGCPIAPVRRFVELGVPVSLGMDSAASSGPIDMFAEMRAALDSSRRLKEPLTAATAWNLATSAGASAIGYAENTLQPGYCGELLQLRAPEMQSVEDLIELGAPEMVSWIQIASLPD